MEKVYNSAKHGTHKAESTACSENIYGLSLGTAHRWQLVGTEEAAPWVQKLASIMKLEKCLLNGDPRLIFLRGDPQACGEEAPVHRLDVNLQASLPKTNWRGENFKVLRLWYHADTEDVLCELQPHLDYRLRIISMFLSLYPVYKAAQHSGGLPFHAALVEKHGRGVLLAGPGGTGKSTCCRRLSGPWSALSDDEALIVPNGRTEYLAHPFPTWSDHYNRRSCRTWKVENNVRLRAICFLKQSETDKAVPVGKGKAAALIHESAMHVFQRNWRRLANGEKRKLNKKLFDNACRLSKTIPAFSLHVSLSGRLPEQLESIL